MLFPNNTMASASRSSQKYPKNLTFVYVRISYIAKNETLFADYVRPATEEEAGAFATTKKTPAKLSVLNGIDFRKRDENVFKQGRKKVRIFVFLDIGSVFIIGYRLLAASRILVMTKVKV